MRCELNAFVHIKNKECQGDDEIVDAIFQEWIGSGGQELEMPAEQNEGGDVPAHDKYPEGYAYYCRADGIHLSQVFRRQEKRVGAKGLHERPVHRTEKQEPEQQEHLEFLQMKDHQLHRERTINRSYKLPHKLR